MAKKRAKAGTSKAAAGEKRLLFVEAFCTNGGNATQAAVAAGYKPGSAAEKAGWRLSKDVRVAEKIAARQAETFAKAQETTQLTAEEVLRSLARDIRFDPAKLYDEQGALKPITQLDEDTRLALRSIEVEQLSAGRGKEKIVVGTTAKIRFPEKTAAREQGMKHFGLYKKDNDQAGEAAGRAAAAALAESVDWGSIRARVAQRRKAKPARIAR